MGGEGPRSRSSKEPAKTKSSEPSREGEYWWTGLVGMEMAAVVVALVALGDLEVEVRLVTLLEVLEVLEGLVTEFLSVSPSSEEPARRSRSSRRRLSFLPGEHVSGGVRLRGGGSQSAQYQSGGPLRSDWCCLLWLRVVQSRRTVVALSNAVLDAAALGQVGDLGPVLVGESRGAEGAAGSMGRVLSGSGLLGHSVHVRLLLRHGVDRHGVRLCVCVCEVCEGGRSCSSTFGRVWPRAVEQTGEDGWSGCC